MTVFADLLRDMDDWLDRLDRERDVAMRMMARRGRTDELTIWLDKLELERAEHLELMAQFHRLDQAHYPALVLPERPTRILKASLKSHRKAVAS